MAGISDTVFRTICKENGADMVFSEMVSVDALAHGARPTLELLRFGSYERPIGIQLFGAEPDLFRKGAELVAEFCQPDFIDLNAGCPVQKVVKKNGGASLLKDLDRFSRIVRALVEAVPLPVTIKLRSGWHKNQWVDCEFARCAEACGAKAVTLHPRSQTMGFSGHSFWDRISAVKAAVKIPVIGNGDVTNAAEAAAMKKETGCDGIMIGRGAMGNPWLFSEIKTMLKGVVPADPPRSERRRTALRHIALFREVHGEAHAVREMKKHAAWYIKGVPEASLWRDKIFRAATTREIENAVREALK